MTTTTYEPSTGDRVRVRRYITVGTMTPGPGSVLRADITGRIESTERGGFVINGEFVHPGYVHLGQQDGVSAYAVTVTEPAPLPAWRAANDGGYARRWFLCRGWGTEGGSLPVRERYHFGHSGDLVRYASMQGAQRAADRLNAEEAQS